MWRWRLGFLLHEADYRSPQEFWPLFIWLGVGFLALSIPCFLFVRERGNPNPRPVFQWNAVLSSASETIRTFKSGRQYPGLTRFLVGRVFYTDAINTTIGFMAIYAIHIAMASGLGETAAGELKNFVMLVAISFAVPAGLVWGRVTDRLGPKRTLDLVLLLWILTLGLAIALGVLGLPIIILYIVGSLVGIAMAGIWAADRPYMLRLTPPHRVGEFYGLYGMVGRFSAITGPALWGAATWMFVERLGLPVQQGEAIAIATMLAMVVVSYRILRPVTDAKRDWSKTAKFSNRFAVRTRFDELRRPSLRRWSAADRVRLEGCAWIRRRRRSRRPAAPPSLSSSSPFCSTCSRSG